MTLITYCPLGVRRGTAPTEHIKSASPAESGHERTCRISRFGPLADIELFDYLVGAREQRWRNCAKSLGRLEVDDKFEFRRLLDG